jgi:hypothetical protein
VLTGLMVKNDMTVAAELDKFPTFEVYVLLPTMYLQCKLTDVFFEKIVWMNPIYC